VRRRDHDAAQHQRVAGRVIEIGALAEKQNGERRPENRNEVIERRRPVRPDHLDAAIVEQIRDQRRKNHDIGKRGEGRSVPDGILPGRDLGEEKRRQQKAAPAEQHQCEAEGVDRRALAEQRRVEGVDDLSHKPPDVALVEVKMQQRFQAAAGDDNHDAGEGREHTQHLP